MKSWKGFMPTEKFFIFLLAIFVPLQLFTNQITASFLFTFSIPPIWQLLYCGQTMASLGWKKKALYPSIGSGIISGCFLGFMGGLLLRLGGIGGYGQPLFESFSTRLAQVSMVFPNDISCRLLLVSKTAQGTVVYFFYFIFLVGLGEEMFWRAFLQQKMKRFFPKGLSILITAVCFSLAHSYFYFILSAKEASYFLILIGLAGIFWGYFYDCFENVWGPAISHGITAAIIWKYFFYSVF